LPQTGLGPLPILNYGGPGADFDATGATTRVGALPAGVPPQAPVFTLTGPAVPAGCTVVDVIAVWNWLLDGPPPPTDAIAINGTAVTGALVGSGIPDLCWNKLGGAAYLATGLAGVVALAGPNTVSGATDKALGADPSAYGEGLTLLALYECAGTGTRNVDVYAGYVSTESASVPGDAAWAVAFTKPWVCGELRLFLNALDGQATFDDELYVLGSPVGGLLGGTVAAGNAWQGRLGTPPGPPPASDWLYDHATGDVAAAVALPSPLPGLTLHTIRPPSSDCVGHSLMAVSFSTAIASTTVFNGAGVNPTGYAPVSAPVLGGTYVATVALPAGHVGSALVFFLGGSINGPSLTGLVSGQLLCLPPISVLQLAAGNHSVPIPLDCTLLGKGMGTQAGTIRVAPALHVTLNNAVCC